MSIVRRTKRPRHARRRLDLTAMREVLRDGKVWTFLGLVVTRDGRHFVLEEKDVLVELIMVPGGEPVTARMGAAGGGQGVGIWYVPPPGSEVACIVPDGELECGALIIGVLSSGGLPNGVAAGVTVIANTDKVLIHDGQGNTDSLVKKSAFASHIHPSGTGPTGTANNAGASSSYTEILEAQ